jgi:hypothetical protein
MAMGWLIAFFHLELKTDIILTGLAMNILAAGGTVFLMFSLTGDKGSTSTLDSAQLPAVQIPFVNSIPVLGTLLNGENGAGYNIMSYSAFAARCRDLGLPLPHVIGRTPAGDGRNARSGAVGRHRHSPHALLGAGRERLRARRWVAST